MKLFRLDSPIMVFLSAVADLVLLNLLWLLCCIPVVTIGASTTAMYHVLRHMQADELDSVFRDFFRCFRADFKQSTLVFLVLLIPISAIAANFLLIFNPDNTANIPTYLRAIWMVSALLVSFICSFAFPTMAYFEDTLLKTLRNASILAIANLPRTVLISALNLSPLILFLTATNFFLRSAIFWLLIGGALVAYLNMRIVAPVFRKLLPKTEEAQPEAE